MTHPMKHPEEPIGPDAITLQLSLQGPSARERQDSLLGGKLIVKSPYGLKPMDRMLIEGSEVVPALHILTAAVNSATPAMALAALRPEAEVTYFHFDIFHARQAEMLAGGHRLRNLQCLCTADIPQAEAAPELILAEFRRDGEVGLTLEIIRQAHSRLAYGGKLLVTIDNSHDQWVRHQLEKEFGNITLAARDKNGLLYSVKRKDKPQAGETKESAKLHFTKHVDVKLGELQMEFETCYGTFSSDGLDDGSRALLDVMVPPEPCHAILDLGCGWGGMGILAAKMTGAQKLVMIDANARAVEMAKRNVEKHGLEGAEVRLESDAESILAGSEAGRFDAVIANPPYGTEYRVADMFITMAWRALRPGGQVWLVGKNNAHLVQKTEEAFGNVDVLRRRGYSVVTAVRGDTRKY